MEGEGGTLPICARLVLLLIRTLRMLGLSKMRQVR